MMERDGRKTMIRYVASNLTVLTLIGAVPSVTAQ